ncbi:MAG: hypothetical protein ACR2GR_03535 [Rhodothermales bacterium]
MPALLALRRPPPRRLLAVLVLGVVLSSCSDAPDVPPLAYDVAVRDSTSLASMNQLLYKITPQTDVVPGEDVLRETALSVWDAAGSGDWDEVDVMVYLPGMDVQGEPYATVFVGEDGVSEFVLNPDALTGTRWDEAVAPDSLQ